MESAGKKEVIRFKPGLLDPSLQGIPSHRRNLELDRALGFALQNRRA